MSPKFLIIPAEAEPQLLELLLLDTEKLLRLRATLSERKVVADGREYARVARALDIGNEDAIQLLTARSNIRSQRESFELDDETLYRDLMTFVDGSEGTRDEAYRQALLGVLAQSDDEYFAQKVFELKHAVVPHLHASRSIVDARPVFDKAHTKVEGFLLVAQLELTVIEPGGEPAKVVFSLSRSGLSDLQTQLSDAQRKLDTLAGSLGPIETFE